MEWPFGSLQPFSYDLLVVDPPWLFELRSEKGAAKSAQAHYACMDQAWIEALPIGHLVGVDSWLFLWATAPKLHHAFAVLSAWGFEYKSRMAWRKTTAAKKVRVGGGYVVRSMHEDVLIASIGKPKYSRALPSLFDGLAREHSRKPDEFYRLLESFAPKARRADIFSRETRAGWDACGNEIGKFDNV